METDSLRIRYKIWLETEGKAGVLGDGKWQLLKTIEQTGCLKEAMRIHGLTYRKTWDNLNKIEELLGFPVIERQRGGKEGGKTSLTSQGKKIVSAFDAFHQKYDTVINQALDDTLKQILNKE